LVVSERILARPHQPGFFYSSRPAGSHGIASVKAREKAGIRGEGEARNGSREILVPGVARNFNTRGWTTFGGMGGSV
jgi:hypothetical protein